MYKRQEVYGHILDEDRKKNAQLMENAFYNKENLNPDIHGASGIQNNNNNNIISISASAYLNGDVMKNEETGRISYYTSKKEVVYTLSLIHI